MSSTPSPLTQPAASARESLLKSLYARFGPFVRFSITGGSGLVVNEAVLWLVTSLFGVHHLISPVFATLVSSTWNFTFTQLWVFRAERSLAAWQKRLVPFYALSFAALLLREPIYAVLTDGLHVHYLISNLIAIAVLMVGRYLVARNVIWRPRRAAALAAPAARAGRPE
jgi:dolichol-phosphate mannosyltransferase